MENDTITALATPEGAGGIGIVKISGLRSVEIGVQIFRSFSGKNIDSENSHQLHYGHIVDPEESAVVDEVLLSIMRGPQSYTGEDVVEINAHSGPAVLETILSLVMRCGARPAQAGEFTRRAFLNGRIDLSQAEAVGDIIAAENRAALDIALHQKMGAAQKEIANIRMAIMEMLVQLEAAIDFPEDIHDEIDWDPILKKLQTECIASLKKWIKHSATGEMLRHGLSLVIAGKPNVGKSRLMNRLLGKDRVIVSEEAGTTRDIVSDTLRIHGASLMLYDTAGLRDAGNAIEAAGIQKTYEVLEQAHLVLLVIDGTQAIGQSEKKILEKIEGKETLLVVNKIDQIKNTTKISLPDFIQSIPTVYLSARSGQGVQQLTDTLEFFFKDKMRSGAIEKGFMPNVRQLAAIQKALEHLKDALKGIHGKMPGELISIDLKSAHSSLGEVTGEKIDQKVLDQIFSNFCIGK